MKDPLDTDTMDLVELIENIEKRLKSLEGKVETLQRVVRDNDLDFDMDFDPERDVQ